jgi:hypothetical protein
MKVNGGIEKEKDKENKNGQMVLIMMVINY